MLANATSVMASIRQLEAADAYERGDGARAQALLDQNVKELGVAATAAPAAMAPASPSRRAPTRAPSAFRAAAPAESEAGRSAAKAAAARDMSNFSRNAAF